MFDRLDYALADLLLFSPRVYDRMFELHNAALWPAHLAALAAGLYLVAVALKPSQQAIRLAFGLLAVIWLLVAYQFLYVRYAAINWAVIYVVPFFALMALILAWFAIRPKPVEISCRRNPAGMMALGVLLLSLFGYPMLSVVSDRPWYTAEVFAVAPDPTVTATLAFLAMSRGVTVLPAMIIPLLWTIVTALTLFALGRPEFFVAPLAAAACIAAHLGGASGRAAP